METKQSEVVRKTKNKTTGEYVPDDEQEKTEEKELADMEIGQPLEKRIWNEDSKDDPRLWKRNGGKDEGARNVQQRPRRTKNKQGWIINIWNDSYTNRNQ